MMKIIFTSLEDVKDYRVRSLTVGSFDGLHLGHLKIIRQLEREKPSMLITFSPHPRVLIENKKDFVLTEDDEKIEILKNFDIDYLIFLRFDQTLRNLPYDSFLRKIRERISPSVWIAGPDHTFGKMAEGNTFSLWKFCVQEGIILVLLPYEKAGGEKLSSSLLRRVLKEGRVEEYEKYTGRFYEIKGKVVKGKEMGIKIGFPTANVEVNEEKILPKEGVYMGEVYFQNKYYLSAISVGKSPTFGGRERDVEIYILGFEGDIYGEEIKVVFKRFLREKKKFEEIDSLRKEIEKDIKKIKEVSYGKSS